MDMTRWGEGYTGGYPGAASDHEPMSPVGKGFADGSLSDPDNPFEEPETAPELRQVRSESLYSRSTPFWESVEDQPRESGFPRDPEFWNHPEELREELSAGQMAMQPLKTLWDKLTSRTGKFFVACVVVIAAVAFFGHSVFATVRTIGVEGNISFTDEQVIALSGLKVGMSTLRINEERVMNSIAWKERYLRCTMVDVSYDRVTIHVKERVPVCAMEHNGHLIVLDDRGWVLEIYDDLNAPTQQLITVNGLEVAKRDRGQAVTLRNPARLTVYTQILVELRALGGLGLITELDMTNMDSITLKTYDGLTILLGNESSIHEKVRAMLVVYENLQRNAFYGKATQGTIVVANPEKPAYTPPR